MLHAFGRKHRSAPGAHCTPKLMAWVTRATVPSLETLPDLYTFELTTMMTIGLRQLNDLTGSYSMHPNTHFWPGVGKWTTCVTYRVLRSFEYCGADHPVSAASSTRVPIPRGTECIHLPLHSLRMIAGLTLSTSSTAAQSWH